MSDLRPPATGTEARLQAILEELRAIHGLLEDRLPRPTAEGGSPALLHPGEWRITQEDAAAASEKALTAATQPVKPPTKRTRTRTRA